MSSCNICLETLPSGDTSKFMTTPCGHEFHFFCIDSWLKTSITCVCPLCRFSFIDLSKRESNQHVTVDAMLTFAALMSLRLHMYKINNRVEYETLVNTPELVDEITYLPPIGDDSYDLSTFTNLAVLDVKDQHVNVWKLPRSLKKLKLHRQAVSTLDWVKLVPQLTHLTLKKQMGIEQLDPLLLVKNLEYLELTHSRVCDIAPLYNLTKLKEVYLSHSRIEYLDEGLGCLQNLKVLDLSYSQLHIISEDIETVPLTHLLLTANHLESLPYLPNSLWRLEVASNELTTLQCVQYCRNLRHLDAKFNCLRDIDTVGNCESLRFLDVSNNEISKIRAFHGQNLVFLDASCNQLRSADFARGLYRLSELFLGDNLIDCVYALTRLRNLVVLGLEYNKLSSDTDLPEFPKIRAVNISGNHSLTYARMPGCLVFDDDSVEKSGCMCGSRDWRRCECYDGDESSSSSSSSEDDEDDGDF